MSNFHLNMKNFLCNIAVHTGVETLLRKTNRHPRIVFWHGVDHNVNPLVETEMIEFSNFRKQIEYLHKYYEIISITEMKERIVNKQFTGKEIVLSFDDGYRNNLKVAAPLLKQMHLPFTVFVSTHHIDTGNIFPTSLARLIIWGAEIKKISLPSINLNVVINTTEERRRIAQTISRNLKTQPLAVVDDLYNELLHSISSDDFFRLYNMHKTLKPMSWEEVRELHENYDCTIGAHCIDHLCCHENQDTNVVKEQITQSKVIIEEKLNTPCLYFAYPNGNYTESSNQCVLNAGFKMGVSTKPTRIETANSMAAIPRICLPSDVNIAKIKLNINPR